MKATSPAALFLLNSYRHYECLLNGAQSGVLLLVRLVWGGMFIQTGWGKWQDIPRVTGFFTDIGIPFPMLNAYVVATTELVGGILLVLGLFSRFITVPLLVSMVVAYLTTEQEALHAAAGGDLDPFLTAAPFLFLFASLLILVFGAGRVSADHYLLAKWDPRKNKPNVVE
jgi:putative oxidoreductase